MKNFFVLLLMMFSTSLVFAQSNADSLKKVLSTSKDDLTKLACLNELFYVYVWSYPDSSISYVQQELLLAKKINSDIAQTTASLHYGVFYFIVGDYPQALRSFQEALKWAESTGSFLTISSVYDNMVQVYTDIGDYERALYYEKKAKSITESYWKPRFNRVNNLDTVRHYISILNGFAQIYGKFNYPDSALKYLQLVNDIYIKVYGNTWAAISYEFGDTYSKTGNYSKAIQYYHSGIALSIEDKNNKDLMDNYNGLAKTFRKTRQIDSAIFYANKVIELNKLTRYSISHLDALSLLVDIYKSKHNMDSVAKYLELTVLAKDSLFSQQKIMQIQSITFNEQLRQQQQAEQKQELQNKIKLYSLLTALILFLVIAFILYRKNRHKHKAYTLLQKQKQEIDIQKSKVEQTLEELKARDLSDSVINSLPGIFYLYDEKGKFIRWNKEFEIVSGYNKEEIASMHPTDFFYAHQKDYIIQRIEGVFKYGSNDAEAHFMTKEKKSIPCYLKAVRIIYEGKPCLLGYGIDISERKKAEEELLASEQKYKLLFEGSPLPMWMFSKIDYSIIDVNEAAVLHYGYFRDEFLQMNVRDLRPSEDIDQFIEKVSIPALEGSNQGIWRHKTKDGTLINVEIIAHDIVYQGNLIRLAVANDVTEKILAEEKLKHSYEEIRELASHLEDIREEEKIKISREIHDELGQQLTAIKIDVSSTSKKINGDNEAIKQKLKHTTELIDEAIKTVRKIATELRPGILDDLGLVAALQWQSQEFQKRSGIKIKFDSAESDVTIAKNTAVALFRIYQESLTNVGRHAEATTVSATLQQKDNLIVLHISDDGKGFDVKEIGHKKTLGLLGMKERTLMMGGKYDIISLTGKGTTVAVSVPM